MIVPRAPESAITASKESNGTVLAPATAPQATPKGDVVIMRGQTSSGQFATLTRGGMVKLDKNTIPGDILRGEAYAETLSDVPYSQQFWQSPGIVSSGY